MALVSGSATTDVITSGFIPRTHKTKWHSHNRYNNQKIKKMSNTYSQLYIQAVFAVKYRNAVIEKEWKSQLMAVIGNLINETGCKTIIVNGVEDHVHCFFILKPSISISDLMQSVKAKSSKWVNESKLMLNRFEWQRGFGAFSYSKSHTNNVYNYILNQEEHHKKQSFREEYIEFLNKFEVDYDERYIFEDLI
jgi:putative transposase